MTSDIEKLVDLEHLDTNLFRTRHHCENFNNTLFGGQVLSQALMAAYHTVEDKQPNSMHAYFLRPGSADLPVIYDVEKVRDGQSFSHRHVVARQFGRPIFEASVSFHKSEQGFEHQVAYPESAPSPEKLIAQRQQHSPSPEMQIFENDRSVIPFDFAVANEAVFSSAIISEPENYYWMKTKNPLSDSPILHCCTLAFASDLGLLATALMPHKANLVDKNIMIASVDHAMWFHSQDFRADQWILAKTTSSWAGSARGFAQAQIFNPDKRLVATTAQEGLIRPICAD